MGAGAVSQGTDVASALEAASVDDLQIAIAGIDDDQLQKIQEALKDLAQNDRLRAEDHQPLNGSIKALDRTAAAATAAALEASIERAANALNAADALLICTGAGMGVDSGFGTYRGRHAGVWPPLKALGLEYHDICKAELFVSDPRLAWAFWHFCHQSYVNAQPHAGYRILSSWGSSLQYGLFSTTSNVDGHWSRTIGVGSEKVFEVHGAVTHMQRLEDDGRVWQTPCCEIEALNVPSWDLSPGEAVEVQIDAAASEVNKHKWMTAVVAADGCSITWPEGESMTWPDGESKRIYAVRRPGGMDLCRVSEASRLPECPVTGELARPNIVLFGDRHVCHQRIKEQSNAWAVWTDSLPKDARLVVVEVGAGLTIPTMRLTAESETASFTNATLIRINLDDSEVDNAKLAGRAVSIGGLGALEAISLIDARLQQLKQAKPKARASLGRMAHPGKQRGAAPPVAAKPKVLPSVKASPTRRV